MRTLLKSYEKLIELMWPKQQSCKLDLFLIESVHAFVLKMYRCLWGSVLASKSAEEDDRPVFLRSQFFLVVCFFVMVAGLQGCGGGGGGESAGNPALGGSLAQSPEDAVQNLVAEWQKTGGPLLTVSGAATASATPSSGKPLGFLRFKDFFSGEEWLLQIDRVEYTTGKADQADVHASYYYQNLSVGESVIIFHMIRDQDSWSLLDMEVKSLPAAVVTATGIQGYVIDKASGQAVSGALVSLWSDQTQVSSTTSALDGFYRFLNIAPGKYTIVIARKGYTIKTIGDILVK